MDSLNLTPHTRRQGAHLYERIWEFFAFEREPSLAEYALRIRKEFGITCRPEEPISSFPTPYEKKNCFHAFTIIEKGDTFFGTHIRVDLLRERRKPWGVQKFFECSDAVRQGKDLLPREWEYADNIFFAKDTFVDTKGNVLMPGFEHATRGRMWHARMFKVFERYPCTSIVAVADKPPRYTAF